MKFRNPWELSGQQLPKKKPLLAMDFYFLAWVPNSGNDSPLLISVLRTLAFSLSLTHSLPLF